MLTVRLVALVWLASSAVRSAAKGRYVDRVDGLLNGLTGVIPLDDAL